jgi:hypothetical protein
VELEKYSIGPFTFEGKKVRMDVGVYTLSKPLEFVLPEGSLIEGVTFKPLSDSDASTEVFENAASDRVAA